MNVLEKSCLMLGLLSSRDPFESHLWRMAASSWNDLDYSGSDKLSTSTSHSHFGRKIAREICRFQDKKKKKKKRISLL